MLALILISKEHVGTQGSMGRNIKLEWPIIRNYSPDSAFMIFPGLHVTMPFPRAFTLLRLQYVCICVIIYRCYSKLAMFIFVCILCA